MNDDVNRNVIPITEAWMSQNHQKELEDLVQTAVEKTTEIFCTYLDAQYGEVSDNNLPLIRKRDFFAICNLLASDLLIRALTLLPEDSRNRHMRQLSLNVLESANLLSKYGEEFFESNIDSSNDNKEE